MDKKQGQNVKTGDVLATCYTDKLVSEDVKELIYNAFVIE